MLPKRWVLTLLSLLMAIVYSNIGPEEIGAATKATKPVELQLWHIWGGDRVPLMEKVIADFEKQYPGIKVKHMVLPGGDRLNKFLVALAGGAPPDVMMLGRHELPMLASEGAVLPLDKYIAQDKVDTGIFFEPEFRSCSWQGKTYLLPMPTGGAVNNVLYYNKDLFEAAGLDPRRPPETWPELEQYAKKLTLWSGKTMKQLGIDIRGQGDRNWLAWLCSNNGENDYATPDGRKYLFNSAKAVNTLTWMVKFMDVICGGIETLGAFYGSAPQAFANGKVGMMVTGSWHLFELLAVNPDLQVGLGLIPHAEGAKSRSAIVGGWGYGIPSGVKHPEESWLLVKWLTTSEVGAGWFLRQQKRPSPIRAFTLDPSMRKLNPYWDVLIQALGSSIVLPLTPVEPQVWANVDGAMLDKAFRHQMAPEAALDWGVQQAQALLDEYWKKKGK